VPFGVPGGAIVRDTIRPAAIFPVTGGNLTGIWDGFYTLTLTQSGTNISGSAGFPDVPSTPGVTISFSGPVSGTVRVQHSRQPISGHC